MFHFDAADAAADAADAAADAADDAAAVVAPTGGSQGGAVQCHLAAKISLFFSEDFRTSIVDCAHKTFFEIEIIDSFPRREHGRFTKK